MMRIRLGTRESALAMWQADTVAAALRDAGHDVELVPITSEGDRVLDTPLPLMGGKGVFTKALDDALLAGGIDIAVHSHKDIPTAMEPGIAIGAVLEREDPRDALVVRNGLAFLESDDGLIATGSPRRAGQWLHRHPGHRTTDLRGNVPTRLRKLKESDWDGAIFALAGLKRLGMEHHVALRLDWMLPAPAQGAVAVACREGDAMVMDALQGLHHAETAACVRAERAYLNRLNGGCSAPVGALAVWDGGRIVLNGNVLSPDGRDRYDIDVSGPVGNPEAVGIEAAERILERGAGWLLGS
jgi:hydroxymethylbilane synthase